MEKIWFSS